MAFGKGRTNKRSSSSSASSSSSYASTITMVIFIALCVLGLWLFTSNSVIKPQTSTRTGIDDFPASNSRVGKSRIDRKTSRTPAFEDNPGDLPDDAIKSDKQKQESSESEIRSDSGDETSNVEQSNDNKQETTEQGDGDNDSGDGNKNEEEQKSSEESASVLEESKGEDSAEEEKPREIETQSSEERYEAQNQRDEQTETTDPDSQQTVDDPESNIQQENDDQQSRNEEQLQNDEGVTDTTQESDEDSKKTSDNQQEQENRNTQRTESEAAAITDDHLQNDDQESKNQEQNQEDSITNETNTDSKEAAESLQEQNQNASETNENQNDKETGENLQEPNQSARETKENQNDKETGENPQEHNQVDNETPENHQEQNQNDQDALIENNSLDSDEDSKQKMENQQQQEQENHVENTKSQPSSQTPTEDQEQKTEDTTSGDEKSSESNTGSSFPDGENSGIPKESKESKKSWSTQADQSENEKERRKDGSTHGNDDNIYGYTWKLCNVTAGNDYIPCLDNEKFLSTFHKRKNHEHRERHCPEEAHTCLVSTPDGYKRPIEWPRSRDKIWYRNVPHTMLAEVKGHQNWVKVTGEYLTFPGGGTQFIHGALHYIDFVQQSVPRIAWGKNTRVILDVGCGVASFGGYLFERGVLTMSFAPKDEHEAQVQFALERGIPAISAVMGSQRLPFPSRVFDLVHCARCRVPWHENGGALLLELNRVLRPGGHFVWSATPVYQKLEEDVEIWKAMSSLTASMCWELVTIKKDKLNSVGAAIYHKPTTNDCYDQRKQNRPPMCKSDDDPNAAWYVPLEACMHRAPVGMKERGKKWPESWPARIQTPPYWLNSSQIGIYGKPAPLDFAKDYEHWTRVVNKLYRNGLGINWSTVRNVMDMRAVYGGFAAALKDLQVWVFNVVNVDSPDTLPIIYERGLFGIYHDWCESFSTYPRSYDLLHADHLFSRVKKRCKIVPLMAEIDRIVRPGGKFIVRDDSNTVGEVENLLKSLHWEVNLTFSKDQEGILSATKSDWRPEIYEAAS